MPVRKKRRRKRFRFLRPFSHHGLPFAGPKSPLRFPNRSYEARTPFAPPCRKPHATSRRSSGRFPIRAGTSVPEAQCHDASGCRFTRNFIDTTIGYLDACENAAPAVRAKRNVMLSCGWEERQEFRIDKEDCLGNVPECPACRLAALRPRKRS